MKTYTSGVSAIHLGGTRIRFICPRGHETVRDYGQGPAGHRLTEAAAHRLAVMWDDRIRVPFVCRKCAGRPDARHGAPDRAPRDARRTRRG